MKLIVKRLAWTFAIFLSLALFDPLGIGTYTKTGVQKLWVSMEGFDAAHQKAASEVLVVLIEDDFIFQENTGYPLPYLVMADLIDATALGNPKAIYLNFSFVYKRSDSDIAILKEALVSTGTATRFYLPSGNVDVGSPRGILDDLLCSDDGANCDGSALPITLTSDAKWPDNSVITLYPSRPGTSGLTSAGVGMACDMAPPEGMTPAECRQNVPEFFDPVWPAIPSVCIEVDKKKNILPKGCAKISRSWPDYLFRYFRHNLFGTRAPKGFASPQSYLSQFHPFATISAQEVLALSPATEDRLRGATVFIGINSGLLSDYAQSANYGPVPSVFLEAAAYNTMVASKSQPSLSMNVPGTSHLPIDLIVGAIIFIVIAAVQMLLQRLRGRPTGKRMSAWIDLFGSISIGALTLFVVAYFFNIVVASTFLVVYSLILNFLLDFLSHSNLKKTPKP